MRHPPRGGLLPSLKAASWPSGCIESERTLVAGLHGGRGSGRLFCRPRFKAACGHQSVLFAALAAAALQLADPHSAAVWKCELLACNAEEAVHRRWCMHQRTRVAPAFWLLLAATPAGRLVRERRPAAL